MNVGDYVRTEKGIIGKFNVVKTGETIPNWNGGYGYKEIDKEYIDNNIYNRFDDKIIKSSPQIIDLIEVGDYVNGRKVSKINLDRTLNKEKCILCADTNYDCLDTVYKNEDIKSIVTHEQMEAIQYRVEE